MKKRNLLIVAALACVQLASVALLTVGCETESVTQTDVLIQPAYSELRRGESVALTASGWTTYRWTLPSGGTVDQYGFLSAGVGERVVYTVTATPSNGYSQVISVAADVALATTPGASGTARVKHIWAAGDTDPDVPEVPDVKVTPLNTELSVGQTVTLRATGWTSYRWSLSPGGDSYGHLSAVTGDKVVYTADSAGGETGFAQIIMVSAVGSSEGVYQATSRVKHK